MTTFLTADHHFGHAPIIGYCARPFASVEEMDAAMITPGIVRRQPSQVGSRERATIAEPTGRTT